MDSKEYGYGKEINTQELVGEIVIVATRLSGLEVKGKLRAFFERTQAITLSDYNITMRQDDDSIKVLEKGDIIFMKQDAWLTMRAKTVMNRKLLA